MQWRGRGRQNSRGIGRTSEVVRDCFLRNFQRRPRLLKCSCDFCKKYFMNKKYFRKSAKFFISLWKFFLSIFCGFSRIFWNFWKSRFFANRYWSRVRLYIGIYRRSKKGSFSSILWGSTHLFWKKGVGGDDDFDCNGKNKKKNKIYIVEHRISRVRPRSASLAHAGGCITTTNW